MKKVNIIYWIATGLILALMLFSAISSFIPNPDGAKMMDQMGYKPYVMHFLAVAKVLGIIAILTPGLPRLKEWAYAGFAFDLIGATYSMYASGMEPKNWAPMFIFIAILFVSYIYHHKRLKLKASGVKDATV
jgi:DoxX-like family